MAGDHWDTNIILPDVVATGTVVEAVRVLPVAGVGVGGDGGGPVRVVVVLVLVSVL